MARVSISRVGDKTSHGGIIIQGSMTRKVGTRFVARLGDKCTCPLHGSTIIIKIIQKMPYTDGLPTAHSGAITACGAVLLPPPGFSTEYQGTGS